MDRPFGTHSRTLLDGIVRIARFRIWGSKTVIFFLQPQLFHRVNLCWRFGTVVFNRCSGLPLSSVYNTKGLASKLAVEGSRLHKSKSSLIGRPSLRHPWETVLGTPNRVDSWQQRGCKTLLTAWPFQQQDKYLPGDDTTRTHFSSGISRHLSLLFMSLARRGDLVFSHAL